MQDDNPLRLLDDSYMPVFVETLVDPVRALTHFFDVGRLFGDVEYTAGDDKHKKKSLRMLMGKAKGDKRQRKARPGDDNAATGSSNQLDAKTTQRITDEAERICHHVVDGQELFPIVVGRIANIRSRDMLDTLYHLAPHFLIDHTVSQHPRMQQLQMADIRLYVRCGRCELESYIVRCAAAENLTASSADNRLQSVLQFGGSHISTLAGKELASVLPVSWALHQTTHTPLDEREAHEQQQRVLAEFPLLLIGLFACLQWHHKKQQLIELLTRRLI